MSVDVREAQPGDEWHIVRLVKTLARSAGERSPLTEDYASDYLRAGSAGVLMAEEDGEVVGLLSYSIRPNLYHAGSSGLIEELIVDECARGHGVGSALIAEVLRRLEAVGCAEVSVSTMPGNERAQRFYRSHGFADEAVLLEKHFRRL